MRISDWSSDVCSSDLATPARSPGSRGYPRCTSARSRLQPSRDRPLQCGNPGCSLRASGRRGRSRAASTPASAPSTSRRSEEHTSELQSLMRNSYDVFCLHQKNKEENSTITNDIADSTYYIKKQVH